MRLWAADFALMFGGSLDEKTAMELASHDWRYKPVDNETSNKLVLDLLHMVEKRSFSVAGENVERWQKGWAENLEEFRRTRDVEALAPKYLRPSQYLRLNGRLIEPIDPMFEANWYKVFRGWFARRYLSRFDHIYEFGCGSGHNVAFLAHEFPDKKITGLDWCEASCDILRALEMPNVFTGQFDFFDPPDFELEPNSAVLTIGALEQTGLRWRPFVRFLRHAQPTVCFHIEPMMEWYDPANLLDHTAIKLHAARGFWQGFAEAVTPLRKHRTGFGSLLLEGYSQLSWSPHETAV